MFRSFAWFGCVRREDINMYLSIEGQLPMYLHLKQLARLETTEKEQEIGLTFKQIEMRS